MKASLESNPEKGSDCSQHSQNHSIARRSLYLFFFLFSPYGLLAQERDTSVLQELTTQLDRYAASRQQVDLYLHLDKSVYLHNENIWFTAYVLNSLPGGVEQHTLYVLLVEETSRKIVASDRFVLDHGLGGGSLFLPDSLPDSEYRLLAYTNTYSTHQDHLVFQQAITLKSADPPLFKLSSLYALPARAESDYVTLGYKVTTSYGGVASEADFKYFLYADSKKVDSGAEKANAFGEVSFMVSKNAVIGHQTSLQSTVTRSKEQQTLKMAVPLYRENVVVKVYPEGGELVDGNTCYAGIEIKNGSNLPVATEGQLLEDGRPVASFTTDELGAGIIKFTPTAGKTYRLQLDNENLKLEPNVFPSVAPTGFSLHIDNAVIRNDVIVAQISIPAGDTCHLVVHNYRNVFYSATIVARNKQAALRIAAADMPEGVVTLTLFNRDGKPRVERAVYIKRSEPLRVQMTADSASYHNRSKVQLKIKISNSQGQPVKNAFFSLACVLGSRLDTTRTIDIIRYNQFDRFLPAMMGMPGGRYLEMQENIERILLTRFWTKYKWDYVAQVQVPQQKEELDCDAGYVLFNGRKVKKSLQMVLAGGRQSHVFTTDSNGYFKLPYQTLRVDAGQKIRLLMPGDKDAKGRNYSVQLCVRPGMFDHELSVRDYPVAGYIEAELTAREQQLLKKTMQAVVVTAKRQDDLEVIPVYKSVNCEDWVCMNNILNCRNHPTGTVPVEGTRYYYNGRIPVRYEGCELKEGWNKAGAFVKLVNGISYPKEFYVADYAKFNPAAPEVLSTIFWSYKTITNEKGEATLHFSTNDLEGRFTCVLQGYSDEGPISARTSFKVIE